MYELISGKYFLLCFTLGVYALSKWAQNKTGWVLLNPVLLSIALVISLLKVADIDYSKYAEAGSMIDVWLSPSVVALGVPLYLQLDSIKRQLLPILLSQIAGCLAGLLSVVYIAKWLGATDQVILSLAPKSVTTPIAMQISEMTGGIPALTTSAVVCTGLFGAIFGFSILKLVKVDTNIGESISIGTGSHAVGTGRAMEISPRFGAYSSLGLSINGILTAIIAPFLLEIIM